MPRARSPRKKLVNAWFDDETRAMIDSGAKAAGITKTEFLRQAIMVLAKKLNVPTTKGGTKNKDN